MTFSLNGCFLSTNGYEIVNILSKAKLWKGYCLSVLYTLAFFSVKIRFLVS